MNNFDLHLFLLNFVLFLYIAGFLTISVQILLIKKPIISKNISLILLIILAVQNMINSFGFKNGNIIYIENIYIFIFSIIVFLFIIIIPFFKKRYDIFGIIDDDFKKIIIDTLDTQNINYEIIEKSSIFYKNKSFKYIKAKGIDYEMSITLTSGSNFFLITLLKGGINNKNFDLFIKQFKRIIKSSPVKVNTIPGIILLGLALFLSGIFIIYQLI